MAALTAKLFSKVAATFYTPIDNIRIPVSVFKIITILVDKYFPNGVEHLFMHSLVIGISSLKKCLFTSLAHFFSWTIWLFIIEL